MNKTKKALLAALACSAVLATGAFGLAACNKGGGNDGEKHEHSWGSWTVTDANKPTGTAKGKATRTCSGTGECDAAATEKEYELPVLTSTDYSKGADNATCSATGSVQYTYNKDDVNVSFSVSTPVNSAAHKYGDYVEDGAEGHYQVCEHNSAHKTATQAHDTNGTNGACSLCGYDANHEHTFDTTTWDKDETGHWHPTNCGHDLDIKNSASGYAAHTYGDWTVTTPATPTTEGEQTRTCTVEGCGYIDRQTISKLPTPVTGSDDPDVPKAIAAGKYSVVINGAPSKWNPSYIMADEFYFKLVGGAETKTYTLSIESDNAYIGTPNGGTVIDSVSVVLGEREEYTFSVSADFKEAGSIDAIFAITESDPPAEGTALRPITVKKNGRFGKEDVEEGEKVFFMLDRNALGNKTVNFTLGQYVKLHQVKEDYLTSGKDEDLYGTPPVVFTGSGSVNVSEYSNVYFYADCRGGDCFVNFEVAYKDGDKGNPFTVKTGTGDDNANAFNGANGAQWFKLETAGKYILRPDSSYATLQVYTDVNGSAIDYTKSAPLVLNVTAGNPVYIKAGINTWDSGKFSITEFTQDDIGSIASDPIELEQAGEYDLKSGDYFYKFTATTDGFITLSFSAGGSNVYFYQYADEDFVNIAQRRVEGNTEYAIGTNSLVIDMKAGETHYIKTSNDSATGKFSFSFGAVTAHDYVVTVSDGENTFNGVTVKLAYNKLDEKGNLVKDDDGVVIREFITGATDNGDGIYTFKNVDPSRVYSVVLEGLPEGYGYYPNDLVIARNSDTATSYTATVIAHKSYTITFTGAAAGVDLSGIEVTLRDNQANKTYKAVTNESGVAVVSALPPYGNGNFSVTVGIPDSIKENYIYVSGSNRDLSITDAQPEIEVPLSAIVTYNLTLKDADGAFLPDGTKVTVNGVSGTVENGKVSIITAAGVYDIIIDGYATNVKTGATEFELEATCTVAVTGSSNYTNAPELPVGSTPFKGTLNGSAYCKVTIAEAGVYTVSIQLDAASSMFGGGIGTLRLNGTLEDFYNANYNESKYEVEWNGWYAQSFTVTLSAGDVLVLGINNSGTITVAKA